MKLPLNWGADMSPKLSVVVPCFNESVKNLDESFASLKNQTFSDFECIVIDESTNYESASYCKKLCDSDARFNYVRPKRRLGLAASLNLGISLANTEWVARFDSDDVCLLERFELQVNYLVKNPHIGVLGTGLQIINENGDILAYRNYPSSHDAIVDSFYFTTPIAHPTVLYKKELVVKNHGYNPGFKNSEDLDLWLRLLNAGVVFANLDEPLVKYRQAENKRGRAHWNFNLKARVNNFRIDGFFKRVLGIALIGSWLCIPETLQETIYKKIILRGEALNEK
jgi:glycosyltransferase involved in cell wall biosynthesis